MLTTTKCVVGPTRCETFLVTGDIFPAHFRSAVWEVAGVSCWLLVWILFAFVCLLLGGISFIFGVFLFVLFCLLFGSISMIFGGIYLVLFVYVLVVSL